MEPIGCLICFLIVSLYVQPLETIAVLGFILTPIALKMFYEQYTQEREERSDYEKAQAQKLAREESRRMLSGRADWFLEQDDSNDSI